MKAKKKDQPFVHDPNAAQVIKLNGGLHARVLKDGKSYHVKVGSPEFYEKLALIGDEDFQATNLKMAGFTDDDVAIILEAK